MLIQYNCYGALHLLEMSPTTVKHYIFTVLISRFWNVEISLHFNLALSQCSTSICQAFDGQTEFLRVFNFAIFFLLAKFAKI